MLEVLNFGAGVQSTTLLLMSLDGVLPKLDHVVFADTQWEPAAVYRHLEWCKEIAASRGLEISVRTAGNLREDLLEFWGPRGKSADGKRYASIPAYVRNPDGSRGIVRRQCTSEYKIDVIERFIRREVLGLAKGQRWPKGRAVRQWIGISCDEINRMKKSRNPLNPFWHPLIEADVLKKIPKGQLPGINRKRGYTRQDCLSWLQQHGYPEPPRSACIGCPFRRNAEWRKLTPAEFADACEVDRLIRERGKDKAVNEAGELRGQPYLHDSLVPLSAANLGGKNTEWNDWDNECDGVCGV